MIGSAIGSIGKASAKVAQLFRFPAPIQGIDQRNTLGEGNIQTCVYAYNICPFEYGMRVRKGYEEWEVGLETGLGQGFGVHTIIPYDSQDSGMSGDRAFVTTNEGIWDVTAQGAPPFLMVAFINQDPTAGYGVYTHYVTTSGGDLLFYADNLNGLFQFDPLLDSWVQSPPFTYTAGTPPAIEDIKFVVSHKNRLWFIEENTATAWYLPLASITGEVTPFYFGSKFKHGGTLEGLFSWSVDGGAGVDDILVAVSRAGDVIPYKGNDPAAAETWSQIGTYFIGAIPIGPFFGSEHGGELFLLSVYGIVGMNDLLQGVDSKAIQSDTEGSSVSLKISSFLRDKLQKTVDDYGWAVRLCPSEGGVLVSTPTIGTEAPIQFYYNISTNGWAFWRGIPMTAFDTWKGELMLGTADNRVLRMGVPVDNLLLVPIEGEENGQAIEFSILTSFTGLESPGIYKKIKFIRPDFLAIAAPQYSNMARYDYDVAEAIFSPDQSITPDPQGIWDIGIWDASVWGSDVPVPFNSVDGGWGYGRYVAVATKGSCRTITRLVGWDIIYTIGGPLL